MKKKLTEKLRRFKETCRQRGLRLTHQRTEIFRELAQDNSHPSAEEIYTRINKRLPTISLDTIYRTISTFEEFGIIKRVQILDDKGRFDSNTDVHHHLVCRHCRRVEDFSWPDFDSLKTPDSLNSWGNLNSKHVEIHGLCNQCLQKEDKK